MTSVSKVIGLMRDYLGPAGSSLDIDEMPASAPAAGLVYSDDGNYYETIQEALNNATGFVYVGSGSYSENVTVTTQNMTIEGSGRGTEVDGGSTGPAFIIDAEDVSVKDLNADSDTASAQNAITITENGSDALVKNVEGIEAGDIGIFGDADADRCVVIQCRVQNSDNKAIDLAGDDCRVESCYVTGAADDGIRIQGPNSAVVHCYSLQHGNDGIEIEGNGSRCVGNTVEGIGDVGILLQGDDSVCNSNTVENSGDDGIRVQGTDDVIVGNRVGGSTNQDIDTGGATTPTQTGNNTGALN